MVSIGYISHIKDLGDGSRYAMSLRNSNQAFNGVGVLLQLCRSHVSTEAHAGTEAVLQSVMQNNESQQVICGWYDRYTLQEVTSRINPEIPIAFPDGVEDLNVDEMAHVLPGTHRTII
jgi:hypothetical protein